MGPHSVHEYAASLRPRYRLASRREKSHLLDEFCRIANRDRKVAIRLLRHPPKRARRRAGRTGRQRFAVSAKIGTTGSSEGLDSRAFIEGSVLAKIALYSEPSVLAR